MKNNGSSRRPERTIHLDFRKLHQRRGQAVPELDVFRSLLQYPGGKSQAVRAVVALLADHRGPICSPFLGGGSIELNLANQGIEVRGYDLFEPVANFWWCVARNARRVAGYVDELHPVSKKSFSDLRARYHKIRSRYRRAAIYFVLNRSAFNGCAFCGGMSPGHPGFNGAAIERLRDFRIDNFTVEQMDFRQSIARNKGCRLLLDPPYYGIDSLYGHKGELQRNFDHEALYEILKTRDDWILFYNDHPHILRLYRRYRTFLPIWSYGMSKDKRSREILIVNTDINEAAVEALAA